MTVPKGLKKRLPDLQKIAASCFLNAMNRLIKDYPDHNFKSIALLTSESLSYFSICGWSLESMASKAEKWALKEKLDLPPYETKKAQNDPFTGLGEET